MSDPNSQQQPAVVIPWTLLQQIEYNVYSTRPSNANDTWFDDRYEGLNEVFDAAELTSSTISYYDRAVTLYAVEEALSQLQGDYVARAAIEKGTPYAEARAGMEEKCAYSAWSQDRDVDTLLDDEMEWEEFKFKLLDCMEAKDVVEEALLELTEKTGGRAYVA